jgi:AcrR family transcriptional regulator
MAPRAYNTESRKQLQAELKARIARAAAELHAEKGALATSYADIAQRAGVSVPTVYNHFPSQDELMAACTGHAASLAPALPVEEILAAGNLDASARALVDAMDAIHLYFEPWLAWGEERLIPALSDMQAAGRKQLTGLITQMLALHAGDGDHRELAAVWESLLSFAFWHRLVRDHRLSRQAARSSIHQLLLAAAGSAPAASTLRPAPRK